MNWFWIITINLKYLFDEQKINCQNSFDERWNSNSQWPWQLCRQKPSMNQLFYLASNIHSSFARASLVHFSVWFFFFCAYIIIVLWKSERWQRADEQWKHSGLFRKNNRKKMESQIKSTKVNEQDEKCVVPDIEKLLERDSYLKPHEKEIRRRYITRAD